MTFGHGHEEQVFLGRDISRDKNYSEEVAANIDREMRLMIDQAYKRAEESSPNTGKSWIGSPGRCSKERRLKRRSLKRSWPGRSSPHRRVSPLRRKQGDSDTPDKAGTSEQNKPEETEKVTEKPKKMLSWSGRRTASEGQVIADKRVKKGGGLHATFHRFPKGPAWIWPQSCWWWRWRCSSLGS